MPVYSSPVYLQKDRHIKNVTIHLSNTRLLSLTLKLDLSNNLILWTYFSKIRFLCRAERDVIKIEMSD